MLVVFLFPLADSPYIFLAYSVRASVCVTSPAKAETEASSLTIKSYRPGGTRLFLRCDVSVLLRKDLARMIGDLLGAAIV